MASTRNHKRIARGILACGALAAGLALATGTAHAEPALGPILIAPPPQGGPYTWCPGDRLDEGINPATGKGAPGNVVWDNNICHTWYYVDWGYGNISPSVWDGPNTPEEGTAIRQCPPISFMCP